MIINDRKDLDAAPDEVRDRFLASLAGSINKYVWDGTDWVLEQNTAEIEKFDFTLDDFPNAPVLDKPTHNPDEQETERLAEEVRNQRNDLLSQTDYLVMPDYPMTDAERNNIEQYRQALRDISEQPEFPHDIEWPTKE